MPSKLFNEEQLLYIKDTFKSNDMYLEAKAHASNGQQRFIGSDGIGYDIPDFMGVPQDTIEPAPEPYKPQRDSTTTDSETVPWYRNSEAEGGGINLDNYTEPKEAAVQGQNVPQEDLIYEEQTSNVPLMDSLRRRHGNKSNESLLELWAGEQHYINYNVVALGYDASTLESMTRTEKTDYLLQMETWDKVKGFGDGSQGFWDQTLEIGKALATDPTTYVGIGTVGGLFARQGAKETTKVALKSFLKESTKQAMKTGAKVGAIEGTAYGLTDSIFRQVIAQKATEQIDNFGDVDLDATRTLIDTAVGTATGLSLGAALPGAVQAISNKFNEGKDARKIVDELLGEGSDGVPEGVPVATEGTEGLPLATDVPEGVPVATEGTEVPPTPSSPLEVTVPNAKLPPNLRKGRANYGKTPLIFENDIQKALFLATTKSKSSKHYETYVTFAMETLGRSREDINKLGEQLRLQIKTEISKRPGEVTEPLTTSFSYIKMGDVNSAVTPPVAIKATEGAEVPPTGTEGAEVPPTGTEGAEVPPTGTEGASVNTPEQITLVNSMDKVEGQDLPRTPKDGGPINLERTQVFDEQTAQATIDAYKVDTGVALNKDTERAARTKLMSFKTVEEVTTFLKTYSGKIEGLEVDATVVRMLYSSEANKVAKAWSGAKTKTERLNILANNPALLQSLQAITTMVQRGSTAAGRVLQAQKINVSEFNSVLNKIMESTEVIRKVSDKARADGVDVEEAIKGSFSDADMDALMAEMDNLIDITAAHNDHVRVGLPAFNKAENIFRKIERVATEIWLAGNLSSLATQYGALAGSLIKRGTLSGEAYLQWSIGKVLNVQGRMKYNEMKALNEMDWRQGAETLNMMLRMMRGGTGEGAEGVMQRESLDGWNTKWDDETTHGAINSGYLGFEDPKTIFQTVINKSFDVAGNIIRSPFSALTLADDIMKRVYYLPHIKYQLTKEANKKFPGNDQAIAHEVYISEGVAAYDLFYMKKGQRTNTMKIHVVGEMEKFKKNNPEATYDELQEAEFDALASAEDLVAFTLEEKELLDKVGIDALKHEEALTRLRETVFQTDIPVDKSTSAGKFLGVVKGVRDITPLMQTQLPYLKTILNMTKDTIQRVPVMNLLSRDIRADLAAGGPKRVEAVSKMVMGTSIGALGVMLYDNGMLTATTEMADYQTDTAAGIPGGSIRMPGTDTFIPLARIEPWGSYLRFAADGRQMLQEADRLRTIIDQMDPSDVADEDRNTLISWAEDHARIMGSLSYSILSEKSGAASIKKLGNAITNPESDTAQQWVNQYITGFIPMHAAIKQFNEEPLTKEAKSFMEHVRKKLGIMSDKYGDRDTINYLGEVDNDLKRLGHIYWKTAQPKKGDYVMAKLYELHPGLRRANNKLELDNGFIKDLSYKEVYELRTLVNDPKINVRAELFKVMGSKAFQDLPDGVAGENVAYERHTKIFVIRDIYSKAKQAAKKLYISRHSKALKEEYENAINKSKVTAVAPTKGSTQRANVMKDFLGQ